MWYLFNLTTRKKDTPFNSSALQSLQIFLRPRCLIRKLRIAFNKIIRHIFNRKLISRLSLSCRRISTLHKSKIKSWTFYHRLFSLVGVRQEQDIYVRLIDSVTKQVLYIHVSLNRISSIINLLSSQKIV